MVCGFSIEETQYWMMGIFLNRYSDGFGVTHWWLTGPWLSPFWHTRNNQIQKILSLRLNLSNNIIWIIKSRTQINYFSLDECFFFRSLTSKFSLNFGLFGPHQTLAGNYQKNLKAKVLLRENYVGSRAGNWDISLTLTWLTGQKTRMDSGPKFNI